MIPPALRARTTLRSANYIPENPFVGTSPSIFNSPKIIESAKYPKGRILKCPGRTIFSLPYAYRADCGAEGNPERRPYPYPGYEPYTIPKQIIQGDKSCIHSTIEEILPENYTRIRKDQSAREG